MHTQEGGPVSLDNLLPAAERALGSAPGPIERWRKQLKRVDVTHNSFFKFYFPSPHLSGI